MNKYNYYDKVFFVIQIIEICYFISKNYINYFKLFEKTRIKLLM